MQIGHYSLSREPFIVAELSSNHEQDYAKAVSLIFAAKEAGADAVKVQMFTPDMGDKTGRFTDGLWQGMSLYEIYEKACMPIEWVPLLKELAESLGMVFFSTVYEPEMVDVAEGMGLCAYKISSMESDYQPLIEKVAKTGKPMIISTGGLTYTDIHRLKNIIRPYQRHFALLHCVSQYPAKVEDSNLMTLTDMSRSFTRYVGISDHSQGTAVAIASVGWGACIVEKHLTLSKNTLDGAFSLLPEEFKQLVNGCKDAAKAIGKVGYGGKRLVNRKEINGKNVRVIGG